MKCCKSKMIVCALAFVLLFAASCSSGTTPGNAGTDSPAAPPATEASPGQAHQQTLTFPVSERGKTEFNAAVYEIEPFDLSVDFPDGWTLREREPSGSFDTEIALSGLWSVLDIYDGQGERVGAVGYNVYEETAGAEDLPQAIYSQIALGNDYHFDVRDSYTVAAETESGETAVCEVYYSAGVNGGAEKTNKGIVAYDGDLTAYAAFEFIGDKITDAQVLDIAGSVRLSAHNI